MPKPKHWLSTLEAAGHLGVHPMTLARYRREGGGPPFEKLGTGKSCHVRYELGDLDSWVRKNSRTRSRARANQRKARVAS